MDLSENERSRLDVEWMTTSALRDGMAQATGRVEDSTYKQAFALGRQVAPEMYLSVNRILGDPAESQAAQEIRLQARAQSAVDGKTVTPLEYIESEIRKIERQIDALDDEQDDRLLKNILQRHQDVRQELQPRENREVKLILGDAVQTGKGLPESGEGDGYKDYLLNKERILRIRVTHLEAPEDKIGCDLIYENLNCVKKTARIVIIQYKMWERYDQVIHYNPRDDNQNKKMIGATCKSRLCDPDPTRHRAYRLPNCTAFVRPTDRLQQPHSKTTSSSLHIPVCIVEESWQPNQSGGKSIRREYVENRSLTHKTFGDLFDNCMVGSKEIMWDEMTTLYRGYNIFNPSDRVIVHIQVAEG
jgi:hypothetical protein